MTAHDRRRQSVQLMNKCSVKNYVQEDIDGWLPALPGYSMSMGGM